MTLKFNPKETGTMSHYEPQPIDSLELNAKAQYTRDDMETACCLWEAMLELKDKIPALAKCFKYRGTADMRFRAIDMAHSVDAEWQALSEDRQEEMGAFDWEFCPMIIYRIDWSEYIMVELRNEK